MQLHEPPPIEYLIDDLMVPGLYLLAGAPKSRKSFLALHCALAIATGNKVFKRFEVPKAQRCAIP
jgi:RecA-family ATPase